MWATLFSETECCHYLVVFPPTEIGLTEMKFQDNESQCSFIWRLHFDIKDQITIAIAKFKGKKSLHMNKSTVLKSQIPQ